MSSTLWLTALAMLAFAGNSLFARLALSPEGSGPAIDAAGFTGIRLASGAVVLALILIRTTRDDTPLDNTILGSIAGELPGTWISAAALFVYAVCFSFAYARIGAAVGALVLFTSVQATMIGTGLVKGERPGGLEILGLVVAFGAFAWWIAPHVATPEVAGATLMVLSGTAWGVYSLRGRGATNPVAVTAGNFIRTLPIAIPLIVVSLFANGVSGEGLVIALLSGIVASGLGYIVWYSVLPNLTATRAAIVQLSVPVIAAAGGVVFLSEDLTLRFVVAGVLILGGIAVALSVKSKPRTTAAATPEKSGGTQR